MSIRSKNLVPFKIRLLNDDECINLKFQKDALGQNLLDHICADLNILESYFFGLRYTDDLGNRHWVDVGKPVVKQLRAFKVSNPALCFRVRYYPSSMDLIKEEVTRYYLYLQLRRDAHHGRLHVPARSQLLPQLSALVLQSELGDYEDQLLEDGFTQDIKLLPQLATTMEDKITQEYQQLANGMLPADAEYEFIRLVVSLDSYGTDPYLAKDPADSSMVHLGVSHQGLGIFVSFKRMRLYDWTSILKSSIQGKSIVIHVVNTEGQIKPLKYKFVNEGAAHSFWMMFQDQQAFFTLSSAKDAAKIRSGSLRPFKRSSSFRFRGRVLSEVSLDEPKRKSASFLRSSTLSLSRSIAIKAKRDSLNLEERTTSVVHSQSLPLSVANHDGVPADKSLNLSLNKGETTPNESFNNVLSATQFSVEPAPEIFLIGSMTSDKQEDEQMQMDSIHLLESTRVEMESSQDSIDLPHPTQTQTSVDNGVKTMDSVDHHYEHEEDLSSPEERAPRPLPGTEYVNEEHEYIIVEKSPELSGTPKSSTPKPKPRKSPVREKPMVKSLKDGPTSPPMKPKKQRKAPAVEEPVHPEARSKESSRPVSINSQIKPDTVNEFHTVTGSLEAPEDLVYRAKMVLIDYDNSPPPAQDAPLAMPNLSQSNPSKKHSNPLKAITPPPRDVPTTSEPECELTLGTVEKSPRLSNDSVTLSTAQQQTTPSPSSRDPHRPTSSDKDSVGISSGNGRELSLESTKVYPRGAVKQQSQPTPKSNDETSLKSPTSARSREFERENPFRQIHIEDPSLTTSLPLDAFQNPPPKPAVLSPSKKPGAIAALMGKHPKDQHASPNGHVRDAPAKILVIDECLDQESKSEIKSSPATQTERPISLTLQHESRSCEDSNTLSSTPLEMSTDPCSLLNSTNAPAIASPPKPARDLLTPQNVQIGGNAGLGESSTDYNSTPDQGLEPIPTNNNEVNVRNGSVSNIISDDEMDKNSNLKTVSKNPQPPHKSIEQDGDNEGIIKNPEVLNSPFHPETVGSDMEIVAGRLETVDVDQCVDTAVVPCTSSVPESLSEKSILDKDLAQARISDDHDQPSECDESISTGTESFHGSETEEEIDDATSLSPDEMNVRSTDSTRDVPEYTEEACDELMMDAPNTIVDQLQIKPKAQQACDGGPKYDVSEQMVELEAVLPKPIIETGGVYKNSTVLVQPNVAEPEILVHKQSPIKSRKVSTGSSSQYDNGVRVVSLENVKRIGSVDVSDVEGESEDEVETKPDIEPDLEDTSQPNQLVDESHPSGTMFKVTVEVACMEDSSAKTIADLDDVNDERDEPVDELDEFDDEPAIHLLEEPKIVKPAIDIPANNPEAANRPTVYDVTNPARNGQPNKDVTHDTTNDPEAPIIEPVIQHRLTNATADQPATKPTGREPAMFAGYELSDLQPGVNIQAVAAVVVGAVVAAVVAYVNMS